MSSESVRAAAICALVFIGGAIAGCGGTAHQPASVAGVALPSLSAPPAAQVTTGASVPAPTPLRFFAGTGVWNKPLAADAPLDPHSTELVSALDTLIAVEERSGRGPWINTTSYSVPIYTVPANQPTVRVKLAATPPEPALQAAFDAVPLPPTAQPALGTDALLAVWQPSTDRLWEFWRISHGPGGWRAMWGGAMSHVSSNSGVYGNEAWPGARSWWGASASSLSEVGGLISVEDLERGEIDHALSVSLPDIRAGVYSLPARRTDGRSRSPQALPEGAHLRLNPDLNLASLRLPRLTMMIAQAAQRYGIYVKDGAQNVTFDAQDPVSLGSNPYTGAKGYFEGELPEQLLASFPWSQLELLKMELHPERSRGVQLGAARRARRRAERQARVRRRVERRLRRMRERRARDAASPE